jgi:mannose-6-phosphate isomerase-like protein (cupin superfamily)
MPAGTAEVRHLHRTSRQLFFVLSGRLSIEHDGSELDLSPHDALEIPPGVAHCVRNPGPLEAHFLVISAPPSHDDRIEV